MEGYWQDPVETERAFIDGWLRTGDLVTMDEQGYVRIVDRKKDMLISGGLNVYPAEIERVLDTIEGIDEAAVVGVPDARWGEVAVAIVVGHGSLNADDVLAACSARLGRYKVPKRVFFRAEPLPRGDVGQSAQRELCEDYAALCLRRRMNEPSVAALPPRRAWLDSVATSSRCRRGIGSDGLSLFPEWSARSRRAGSPRHGRG